MLLREFSQHSPSTSICSPISLPHQTFPPNFLKDKFPLGSLTFLSLSFSSTHCTLSSPVTGLRFLCSLQANNLACYSFLDASRRPESSGSEDCITYDTVSGTSFMFTAFPLSPGFHLGATWSGPGDATYVVGLCHS